MKKILLFSITMLLGLVAHAQEPSDSLLIDSIRHGSDPAKYYMQYLQKNVGTSVDDEASEKSENTRLLSLWQNRLIAGSNKTNPGLKYAQAIKSVQSVANANTCEPYEGRLSRMVL